MLTEKETQLVKLLEEKIKCNGDKFREDLFIVSNVMGLIELKFGSDVFELMVKYYSALMSSVPLSDNDDLSLLGSMIECKDEVLTKVNKIITDEIHEKVSSTPQCDRATEDEFNMMVDGIRDMLAIAD